MQDLLPQNPSLNKHFARSVFRLDAIPLNHLEVIPPESEKVQLEKQSFRKNLDNFFRCVQPVRQDSSANNVRVRKRQPSNVSIPNQT